MTDIVERLRKWYTPGETITGDVQLYLNAADEIKRLRDELTEAEAMLDSFGKVSPQQYQKELASIRAATIEECLKVIEDWQGEVNLFDIYAAIRALKEQK